MRDILGFLMGFAFLTVVFSAIERLSPSIPGQGWWRRGTRTDLVYWLATPLVFKPLARALAIVCVVVLALVATRGAVVKGDAVRAWAVNGHGPLAALPRGLQAFVALLVADFAGYWLHRLFHRRTLWRFHAVHHSSVALDWLASVRLHPVNESLNSLLSAIVLVGLGFRGDVLQGVIPFFTLYAILLHANVSWSLGPLRYVLASPRFHRWHHTSQEEGLDKNFAGLFPVWDLIFGTFYMPPGRIPVTFGLSREAVPEGFWKQLWWPFQRRG
jgi:sterol desaturase/sphingolipid hydroxylase (fatty acid hydroxylase superfamily)